MSRSMKIVARHLQEEASRRINNDEKDTFGRSAFNRYYYATFLSVKNALGSFRHEWHAMPHGNVPQVLRGEVLKEISKGRARAQKAVDHETVNACNRAVAATNALAQLMEDGYATRVTADYRPDLRVDFSNRFDFKLNFIHVNHASEWPERASGLIRIITIAWRQING